MKKKKKIESKVFISNIPEFVEIDKNKNLKDSLKDAYCVVAYNSTALVDSIIEGCPIICLHEMSVVYNLATHDIKNINNLYIPTNEERLQQLYNISYMQWTDEELKSGEAIEYNLKLLKEIN